MAAATKAYDHRDRLTEVERYRPRLTTTTVDFDLDKMISAYRAILELKPDHPIAPNNLALILDRRGAGPSGTYRTGGHGPPQAGATSSPRWCRPSWPRERRRRARAAVVEYLQRDSPAAPAHRLMAMYFASNQEWDSAGPGPVR